VNRESFETDLDALLSAPLEPIADNGFVAKVLARLEKKKRTRDIVLGAAFLVASVDLVVAFPVSAFMVADVLANPAVAAVALIAVLTPLVSFAIIAGD